MIKIAKSYSSHKIKVGYTEVPRSIAKAAFKLFNFGDIYGAKELLIAHDLSEEEAMAILTAMQDNFNNTLRTYGVEDGALDEVLP
jgi:hypothetical protein